MTYLRVARPTDDLDPIVAMYKTGLDLQVVAEFRGHDGFDGVVLSRPDLGYQIEFTHQAGHSRTPTGIVWSCTTVPRPPHLNGQPDDDAP